MESLDMLSEAGRLFQVGDDQKALKSAVAVSHHHLPVHHPRPRPAFRHPQKLCRNPQLDLAAAAQPWLNTKTLSQTRTTRTRLGWCKPPPPAAPCTV